MITSLLRAAGHGALHAARALPFAAPLLGDPDRLPLVGRTVFITGAARGLGAEIARQAHHQGAHVALVGRRLRPLEELATQLGPRAAAFEADVSDLKALQTAARGAAERFGGIDIVICNAGIAPPSDTILTIDPEAFERTVDVDLLGQWRTIRATLPYVIDRRGHVVVVASIYAFFNGALNASYAASKAGIEQLARALRIELVPHGATAGVAYLGFVQTDLATEVFSQEHVQEARRAVPAVFTQPMAVSDAATAVLRGTTRRAGRICAPRWVGALLAARSVTTTVMDAALMHNATLSSTIRRAEIARNADDQDRPPPGP
jgi:NAD(P)-dependent dehydrogenase (short-subunit alcohol dehydrogenase family)